MARMARVVIPTIPHHVTQRGVRRMETFFDDEDYDMYISLMREWCLSSGVEIWAYCLMPNHVHLIAVPESEKSLACVFRRSRPPKPVEAGHPVAVCNPAGLGLLCGVFFCGQ